MTKEQLTADDIRTCIELMSRKVHAARERLIELDSALGDGDLGLTMTRGFGAARDELKDMDEDDIGRILMKTGMTIAKTAPSTMGTLVATGFMKAGKALAGKTELSAENCAVMISAFNEGIMERGKAQPGDKTIVDVLAPAAAALETCAKQGRSLGECVASALEAAVSGAAKAGNMKAKFGRPSYYGDDSIGKDDPGAAVGVLIMEALAETVQ